MTRSISPNLLERSKRRTRRVALLCGVIVLTGAGWALLPGGPGPIEAPSLEFAGAQVDRPIVAPLDFKAFQTPVWTIAAAPQPPTPAAPPPPPPPPLKLQLIGIIKEDQAYKAVLYDPDTNKLFVVASGEDAAGHAVDHVAADSVALRDGALVRTLGLKTGSGA